MSISKIFTVPSVSPIKRYCSFKCVIHVALFYKYSLNISLFVVKSYIKISLSSPVDIVNFRFSNRQRNTFFSVFFPRIPKKNGKIRLKRNGI